MTMPGVDPVGGETLVAGGEGALVEVSFAPDVTASIVARAAGFHVSPLFAGASSFARCRVCVDINCFGSRSCRKRLLASPMGAVPTRRRRRSGIIEIELAMGAGFVSIVATIVRWCGGLSIFWVRDDPGSQAACGYGWRRPHRHCRNSAVCVCGLSLVVQETLKRKPTNGDLFVLHCRRW